MTKPQIHKLDQACVHFTGTQHDRCDAGVRYMDVRDNRTREEGWTLATCFPCLPDGEANTKCAKRQYATSEEAEQAAAARESAFTRFVDRMTTGVCQCGVEATGARQVGRCVYLKPCGHRAGEGEAVRYWADVERARALRRGTP